MIWYSLKAVGISLYLRSVNTLLNSSKPREREPTTSAELPEGYEVWATHPPRCPEPSWQRADGAVSRLLPAVGGCGATRWPVAPAVRRILRPPRRPSERYMRRGVEVGASYNPWDRGRSLRPLSPTGSMPQMRNTALPRSGSTTLGRQHAPQVENHLPKAPELEPLQ